MQKKHLIEKCKQDDSSAREWLYNSYAPALYGVCLRYINDRTEAEDILHESFITIFSKIKQLKQDKAIEGWMKKIVVNNSLKHLKKQIKAYNIDEIKEIGIESDHVDKQGDIKEQIMQIEISQKDILAIINNLPAGFRAVFNLYVFENYKHSEIAKVLGISTGTSRSQLQRARKLIQKKLYDWIEQNKTEEKKEKTVWASSIMLMNIDLKYIDQLVYEKLNGYQATPLADKSTFSTALGKLDNTLVYGLKDKIALFLSKNMLWMGLAVITGFSGIYLLTKTHSEKEQLSPVDMKGEISEPDCSQENTSLSETLKFKGNISENVDTTKQANDQQTDIKKPLIKRVTITKKKKIIIRRNTNDTLQNQ